MASTAQNIYSTTTFFDAYATLPRSQHGLSAMPEWPTMRQMLGNIEGRRVLDLGSGYGWFCRWAASRSPFPEGGGASSVRGIEISELMLNRAKELDAQWLETNKTAGDCEIFYNIGDLETIVLEAESVDVVYSSLTFHYLPSPATKRLFDQVNKTLVANGLLVFSVEHPTMTAPVTPKAQFETASSDGGEQLYWPLNSYAVEGERITDWLAPGVRKYHRTVETYVNLLLDAGFVIEGLRESWEGMDVREREAQRPFFLMLKARKKG
jgi:SAM-dependent methyltransferase